MAQAKPKTGCLMTVIQGVVALFAIATLGTFIPSWNDPLVYLLFFIWSWIGMRFIWNFFAYMVSSDSDTEAPLEATSSELRSDYSRKNPFINDANDQVVKVQRQREKNKRWLPPEDRLNEPDYVIVDFEAANKDPLSACAIALVRFTKGQAADTFFSYIQPPEGYEEFIFTNLHGIGPDEVADAPTWDQLKDEVLAFVGEHTVYAHNAAYDARVWRRLDKFYEVETYPQRFYCTLQLSYKVLPDLERHNLPTVLKACSPDTKLDHHNALSDANACGVIAWRLRPLLET